MTTEYQKKYMLDYYYAHRDEIMLYQKKYFKEHKEQIQDRQRKYRHENRDKIKFYYKQYYRKNKRKLTEQHKEYQQKHYVYKDRHTCNADFYDVYKDGQFFQRFENMQEVCDFIGYSKTTIYEYIKKDKDFFGYKVYMIYME